MPGTTQQQGEYNENTATLLSEWRKAFEAKTQLDHEIARLSAALDGMWAEIQRRLGAAVAAAPDRSQGGKERSASSKTSKKTDAIERLVEWVREHPETLATADVIAKALGMTIDRATAALSAAARLSLIQRRSRGHYGPLP